MNTLIAATDPSQNVFKTIIDAYIPIGQYKLYWLELIGVSIGVASAYLGMKRLVWAWPVGITANIMLFFVYIGGAFGLEGSKEDKGYEATSAALLTAVTLKKIRRREHLG